MAKNKKHTITPEQLRQIAKRKRRDDMLEQGAGDGRYSTKVVKSRKKYGNKQRRQNNVRVY